MYYNFELIVTQSRNQIVGHVIFEIENDDTLLYTSFATSEFWRGRVRFKDFLNTVFTFVQGVAKLMVSHLMQWAFSQPNLVNGRMHVRGGHAQVVGLYKYYGFDIVPHDDDVDGEQEFYDDGEPMLTMGGPLRFDVFAKRLGWHWNSREEMISELV